MEKGSVSTANGHGSAGPERGGKPIKEFLRQYRAGVNGRLLG